jgi:chromosome partitioning protein
MIGRRRQHRDRGSGEVAPDVPAPEEEVQEEMDVVVRPEGKMPAPDLAVEDLPSSPTTPPRSSDTPPQGVPVDPPMSEGRHVRDEDRVIADVGDGTATVGPTSIPGEHGTVRPGGIPHSTGVATVAEPGHGTAPGAAGEARGESGSELDETARMESRTLPRVLAVANQKGGVGKTTTTVNLGAALAELGYRVLVVDLDPQGNATTGLGIDTRNFEHSMYDVIMREVPLEDCIEPTSVRNLFVAPATIDLAGVEIELVPVFSRELRLRKAIEAVVDDFDFLLIDCPPSLGLITVNGLAAAREVLVPIQCEYYALEGLGQLLRNVHLVASNLNEQLQISTIVLTMYDARTRLAEEVAAEVRKHFGGRVCRVVIPRTIRLSEAPSFGQPITVFDPTSRGAVAYRELAKEVSDGAPKRTG